MNFLNPGLLGSYTTFNSYFSTQLAANLKHEVGDELLKLLQPFVLRRSKEDVAPELPPITEMISYCTMDEGQLKMYETEKSKVRNQIMEGVQDGVKSSSVMVLQALMQLRQIANHPRLIDPDSQSGSGKFDEITEKLLIILSENHKVLVFSSFVRHLKLFESWCKENRIRYAMLTGSTTDRENVVQSFKNDSEINIFLISLKAGGVGLNLAEADYVFILDPWWNPAAEMQAISRSHRIGQNRSVFVYRFITKGTVEEKIVRLQEKKKTLAKKFILSDSAIAGMSSEEVMEFFI
jgi:SNF2 family DNA or RNA helicase